MITLIIYEDFKKFYLNNKTIMLNFLWDQEGYLELSSFKKIREILKVRELNKLNSILIFENSIIVSDQILFWKNNP